MNPDIDQLRRRLDTLTRAATSLRTHAADLWIFGWEPTSHDGEHVAGGNTDWAPKTGHPAARKLFDRIAVNVAQMEAELVGYERTMKALFFAGSSSAEPSRGSLIPAAEHQRLLADQRSRAADGQHVAARLVDQPQHPGQNR